MILRFLFSAIFILSAIAKLFAIDDFELYIYSFSFLSLNASFLLARLCIGVELALGLLFLFSRNTPSKHKWLPAVRGRKLATVAILLLIVFSVFLCYAAIIGRTDSCHCMGRLLSMPPAVSLLKNAILILLLLVYVRLQDIETSKLTHSHINALTHSRFPLLLLLLLSIATPFMVSVPDNWMFGPEESRYNKELAVQVIADVHQEKGHRLVAFVTPGCPYCKMAQSKLNSLVARNHIDPDKVVYILPDDIGQQMFLDITFGQRPLLVLVDEGNPVQTFHYRNIDERRIAQFLR